MYKGIGPNKLGSPIKQVMSGDEINAALRNKREKTGTGGIEVDNTLVGVGAGTFVKAGVKNLAARTAGSWTGRKTGAIADAAITAYETLPNK